MQQTQRGPNAATAHTMLRFPWQREGMRRMFRGGLPLLAVLLSGAAMLPWPSESHAVDLSKKCQVKTDDGRFWIKRGRNCSDYYPKNHPCGTERNSSTVIYSNPGLAHAMKSCRAHDMFKVVDWNNTDMIINTHRGIWGMNLSDSAATDKSFTMTLGGAPENSFAGVVAAKRAGFTSVEYDIILMRGADGSRPQPVVNHYLDLRAFTDYKGPQKIPATGVDGAKGFLVNQTDLPDVTLRNRAGVVAFPGDDNKLSSVSGFLYGISYRYPDVLVVLDVKWAKQLVQIQQRTGEDGSATRRAWCIGFCNAFPKENAYAEVVQLINLTLEKAWISDTLQNIVIKIPQFEGVTADKLRSDIPLFGYVQWAPQPLVGADNEGKNKEKVLDYIDGWIDLGTEYISFWDTTIYSTQSWMGRAFVRNGKTYLDLMDYLRQESNRRASIWAPDPSGPGGRNGNYAMTSTNYGNSDDDTRGDLLSNFVYSESLNAVISTDRPDVALEIRNDLSR